MVGHLRLLIEAEVWPFFRFRSGMVWYGIVWHLRLLVEAEDLVELGHWHPLQFVAFVRAGIRRRVILAVAAGQPRT